MSRIIGKLWSGFKNILSHIRLYYRYYTRYYIPGNNEETGDKHEDLNLPKLRRDPQGRVIHTPGAILLNKYEFHEILGRGAFGSVFKVKDLEVNEFKALKMVNYGIDFTTSAKSEIAVLQYLEEIDPFDFSLSIRLLDWFDHYGHICLEFKLYGPSIYTFLKENNFHPYNMEVITHVGYQLCYAVEYLHKNKIIHTDLKPENVLFVNPAYTVIIENNKKVKIIQDSEIKLIDFGCAVPKCSNHKGLISTRDYRSPEVILDLTWTNMVDVWAIGCILFEMYNGFPLFECSEDFEQLAAFERVLGKLPPEMCRESATNFFIDGELNWAGQPLQAFYVKNYWKELKDYQKFLRDDNLFDLILNCLIYEPTKRIALEDATTHDLFKYPEIDWI